MSSALPPRSAVDPANTWDLTAIFSDANAWRAATHQLVDQARQFSHRYAHHLDTTTNVVAALDDLNGIETLREQVACYTEFPQSADSTNPELNARVATNATVQANVDSALSFLHPALAQLPTTVLDTVVRERPQYAGYIRHLVATQAHVLSPELESTLATLAPALNTFRNIRRQALRQTWTSAPSPHTGTLTRSTL